jgi:hypothetical protein
LTFLETVEGAAAPTGVIDALDTNWILGCYLGRSGAPHLKSTYRKGRQKNAAHYSSPVSSIG